MQKITVHINTSALPIVQNKLGSVPARFKSLREARNFLHCASLWVSAHEGEALDAGVIKVNDRIVN